MYVRWFDRILRKSPDYLKLSPLTYVPRSPLRQRRLDSETLYFSRQGSGTLDRHSTDRWFNGLCEEQPIRWELTEDNNSKLNIQLAGLVVAWNDKPDYYYDESPKCYRSHDFIPNDGEIHVYRLYVRLVKFDSEQLNATRLSVGIADDECESRNMFYGASPLGRCNHCFVWDISALHVYPGRSQGYEYPMYLLPRNCAGLDNSDIEKLDIKMIINTRTASVHFYVDGFYMGRAFGYKSDSQFRIMVAANLPIKSLMVTKLSNNPHSLSSLSMLKMWSNWGSFDKAESCEDTKKFVADLLEHIILRPIQMCK